MDVRKKCIPNGRLHVPQGVVLLNGRIFLEFLQGYPLKKFLLSYTNTETFVIFTTIFFYYLIELFSAEISNSLTPLEYVCILINSLINTL